MLLSLSLVASVTPPLTFTVLPSLRSTFVPLSPAKVSGLLATAYSWLPFTASVLVLLSVPAATFLTCTGLPLSLPTRLTVLVGSVLALPVLSTYCIGVSKLTLVTPSLLSTLATVPWPLAKLTVSPWVTKSFATPLPCTVKPALSTSLTVAALLPPLPLVRSARLPPAGVPAALPLAASLRLSLTLARVIGAVVLPAAVFMEAMTSAGWISLPPVAAS